MKKTLICVIIMIIIVCSLFIAADLINITGYIPFSKNYDWLAFYGTIIGGTLTLLGVYFTIKYQSKVDKEKNRISAMPIFEYKVHYCKEDFDNSQGQLAGEIISHIELEGANHQQKDACEWWYSLLVSNVGIGHAIIEQIDFVFGDNQKKQIQTFNEGYVYKLIKQNEVKSFKFLIYSPASRFEGTDFCYTAEITITYKDLLGNKYTQLIHSCLARSDLDNHTFADLNHYEPFQYISNH